MDRKYSNLVIDLHLHKKSLLNYISSFVKQKLSNGIKINTEEVTINVHGISDTSINIVGTLVYLETNLSLYVSKKIVLAMVDLEAELRLTLTFDIRLTEHWDLKIKSDIYDYVWLKKPEFDVGIFNFSTESLANLAVEKAEQGITKQINQIIRDKINFKFHINKLWEEINLDRLINPEVKLWLKPKTQSLSMEIIRYDDDYINTKLIGKALIKLEVDKEHKRDSIPELYPFKWFDSHSETSNLILHSSSSFISISYALNRIMSKESFDYAGRKFKLLNTNIKPVGKYIIIEADLDGAFNGNAVSRFEPYFDPRNQTLHFKNIDLELHTDNWIHKLAVKLLKQPLLNKLKAKLPLSLNEFLDHLKKRLKDQLKSVNTKEGLDIDIKNIDLKFEELSFDKKYINCRISAEADLSIVVQDVQLIVENIGSGNI